MGIALGKYLLLESGYTRTLPRKEWSTLFSLRRGFLDADRRKPVAIGTVLS